jgi:catechol 2,3-dioxygenase-like lactoylglutathione lyase family enzyme
MPKEQQAMPQRPPSRRGTIHHVDLTVTDPRVSAPLYDMVLSFLGYQRGKVSDDGATEWNHPDDAFLSIGIVKARGSNAGRKHDRYSPGLHHLAWGSDTREDVDALHEKLKAVGADILDPPADYPQYNQGRGYYAVFFADPDGIKLEYAWTPAGAT